VDIESDNRCYRTVHGGDVGSLGCVVRGHRPQRLPVVLTEDEVRRVLSNLQGTPALVAQNLYGGGLRLIESPSYRRASRRRCGHT
jgi:hypothetical protein